MKKFVALIIFLGLIIRFSNFNNWHGFDYDQEINAWIAKSIIVDHKPVLIGPETSVGGMYIGPYFNYIIAGFFALGKMNPSATILLNILLAGITMIIFYLVALKLFNPKTALIGLIFYAFSCAIGKYDQVLWDPTPIPLISLLFFYFLLKNRIILAAFFLGIMFHLHFQAILMTAVLGIDLLLFNRKAIFNFKNILGILTVIIIFFAPLIIFDFRHEFLNFSHLVKFFWGNSGLSINLDFYIIWHVMDILISTFRDLIYDQGYWLVKLAVLILPIETFIYLVKNYKHNFYKIFLTAIFVVLSAFIFYKGSLPPYYFLFLYPIFIIALSDWLSQQKESLVVSLLLIFSILNSISLLNTHSDFSLLNKHKAVKYITQKAGDHSFNVDMITHPGLNTGYKYLFWLEGKNPSFDHTAKTEKSFKIVVPSSIAKKEELKTTFGAIGIVELP